MLDLFAVLAKSGAVLWLKAFTPAVANGDIVNRVVCTAFLEERTARQRVDIDGYTVRWTSANDLELTFIAVHQRILQLTYVDDLLVTVRDAFVKRNSEFLRALVRFQPTREQLSAFAADDGWEREFLDMLRTAERSAKRRPAAAAAAAAAGVTAEPAESETAEQGQASESRPPSGPARLPPKASVGPGGRRVISRKKGKSGDDAAPAAGAVAGAAAASSVSASKKGKEMRHWNDIPEPQHMAALDYSGATEGSGDEQLERLIDQSKMGTTRDGIYEVADAAADVGDDNDGENADGTASFLSRIGGGMFDRLGNKPLTSEALEPVLHSMQMQLQSKNVASDVAESICKGVQERLVGKRIGSFGSATAEVRKAVEDAITRLLTPSTSTDILLEITSKRQRRAELLETLPAHVVRGRNVPPALNPYALCFVGVNGVGKSTNLAKVCFWLLQNRMRVLIAACDTFRSGAVEQLRTHVRNLSRLEIDGRRVGEGNADGEPLLELYEKGYGKDAAGIARDALAHARASGFDVVLIDTAGRMQDNEPLMRALAKLIAVNQPDKVIFVGEALVGNEAVDQLTKFDRAIKDYSGIANPHGLDGCLLTKWDTVDDKIGTALTATSATGLPIFFVGTGQTYTDLRQLRVHHVVNALLRT
ncbi:hypothetical protein MCUN1_001406 [Malassezia cuniculi]|uniref:SRP54-type proteins GTP-binding domain-containing protein n=1 Tax=Malassezia cuniculi TaxID=948313 RepID=A0AAF0ESR0_9BASI|nr:hypothetical protein MCUN1_001406 [Malassezia cuniculi]